MKVELSRLFVNANGELCVYTMVSGKEKIAVIYGRCENYFCYYLIEPNDAI